MRATPLSCDIPMAGYYGWAGFIVMLSFLTTGKQTLNWLRRPTHASKIPRGPINQALFTSLELAFLVMIGQNVINFENGWSFSVETLVFLPFTYAYSLGLIRLVSLGEKIIPKSRRPVGEAAAALGKFDNFGKVLLVSQTLGIGIGSLALVILSPTLVEYEFIIATIGWASKSTFMFACIFGYWYQFERCIRVIRQVQHNATIVDLTSSVRFDNKEGELRNKELNAAVLKMRKHQLTHIGAMPAAVGMLLLATGGVPGSIWVIQMMAMSQAFSGIYFEFSVKAQTKRAPGAMKSGDSRRLEIGRVGEALQRMAPNPSSQTMVGMVNVEIDQAESHATDL
jgi:hypothetical protein